MNYEEEIENIDPEITGKFIKSIRKYHNLTQDELAENLFITRKAVSKWETGVGFPSIDVAKRFCDVYGVSFEELIAGKYIFKKREFIINSSLISSTIIFFLLFITIYSAYLNSFLIYKFSFGDNNINIVNSKLLISNKHKYFNLGSVNFNNKNFKNKDIYLEIYTKDENKTKVFSCDYISGRCKNKFVNTSIKRKFIDKNLENFFIKIVYKDKKSKSVTLNKKIFVRKYEKIKKSIDGNSPPSIILDLFGNQKYQNDPLLKMYNDRANDSDNIKEIDLSFLYNMTKDELYKKYNGRRIIHGKSYIFYYDKYLNVLTSKNNNFKLIIYLNECKIEFFSKNRSYSYYFNKKMIFCKNEYKYCLNLYNNLNYIIS